MHALAEVDPAGADVPNGHDEQAVTLPPSEYVLMAHDLHAPELR